MISKSTHSILELLSQPTATLAIPQQLQHTQPCPPVPPTKAEPFQFLTPRGPRPARTFNAAIFPALSRPHGLPAAAAALRAARARSKFGSNMGLNQVLCWLAGTCWRCAFDWAQGVVRAAEGRARIQSSPYPILSSRSHQSEPSVTSRCGGQ